MELKIAFLLVVVSVSSVFATSSYSQVAKVTLDMENKTLEQVMDEIEQQSEFYFIFNQKQIDVDRVLNIKAENMLIDEVLPDLFTGTNVNYVVIDRKILLTTDLIKDNIMFPETVTKLQQNLVTGTVTDASTREPMPGVNVLIKGTTIGAISGENGRYSINVTNSDAILIFSFIGYVNYEIPLNGRAIVNAVLSNELIGLEEVVVIGYGTAKKRDITSAVTSFKADELEYRPITRVDQALVGQMAGVQVKQTTGVTGQAFSIRVRGAGSISAGNEPLYVIDGFPLAQSSPNSSGNYASGNPLDNIEPSNIQSIEVLKDAAAAAIYGSRAANGVVLITTKRGQFGKTKISYNTYAGSSERSRKLDMLSAEEWIDRAVEMANAQWVLSGPGRTASQTTAERRAILGLSVNQVNPNLLIDDRWLQPGHPGLVFIDWQDEAFRKGAVQNHQLLASGGNENVNYYLSGTYANQKGMILGMDYTNYSARVNVEVTASKKLKLGINLAPSYSISNDPGVEGKDNILQRLVLFTPVQEATAGLYPNSFDNDIYPWSSSANSMIATLELSNNRTERFRTLGTIFAEYQIIRNLTFRASVNLDNTDNNVKRYIPYSITGNLTTRLNSPGLGTTGSFNGYRKQTFVNENTLSYKKLINSVHEISVLAGASYNSDKINRVTLSSDGGYGSSVITTLNAAAGVKGNTTETRNVLLSYFARVQYSFNGKYLFSTSLRRDGSSRFGDNTKWGLFPSLALGWRVSDEKFMNNIKSINDLKIRASWGKSGNYSIGDYSTLPLLEFSNYTYNGTKVYGQYPNGIVNPELSWEKSQTVDMGLDLGLFKSRITASFDYYIKLSTDLLLNVPIPASTGFSTSLDNAGEVKNKGWEFELRTRNLTSTFLQWTTSLNLSHNKNELVALASGQTQILIPASQDISHSIMQVGEPMYSINVVKMIGILSQDDIDNNVALYGTETVGDPKYFDANKDGTIDADDRVIVGHPNPDYIWGITNTFNYKGFDLSFLLQGQRGGSIYSLLGRAINRTGTDLTANVIGAQRDRWRSPDDPGAGLVSKAYSNFGRIKNTDWLYSSDYWRIRNITFGYNLGKLISPKYVQDARIYIAAENWFGKDKYYGGFNVDAENTNLSGSSAFPDAGDYGGLPVAKSLIFGLNFTF